MSSSAAQAAGLHGMAHGAAGPSGTSSHGAGDSWGRGRLALALQEPFTVTVRLRTGKQVATDGEAFRAHVKSLLAAADQEARAAGYSPEYVRNAVYAFIAFLDESVLNSNQPMFSSWPRQPLQEEIFGEHVAGENFFRHLRQLLGEQDSEQLADVLEVYELCLVLGFEGRYSAGEKGELHWFTTAAAEKIARIRGPAGPLSPQWGPGAEESLPRARDPWLMRLGVAAAVLLTVALVLFVVYGRLLAGAIAELSS